MELKLRVVLLKVKFFQLEFNLKDVLQGNVNAVVGFMLLIIKRFSNVSQTASNRFSVILTSQGNVTPTNYSNTLRPEGEGAPSESTSPKPNRPAPPNSSGRPALASDAEGSPAVKTAQPSPGPARRPPGPGRRGPPGPNGATGRPPGPGPARRGPPPATAVAATPPPAEAAPKDVPTNSFGPNPTPDPTTATSPAPERTQAPSQGPARRPPGPGRRGPPGPNGANGRPPGPARRGPPPGAAASPPPATQEVKAAPVETVKVSETPSSPPVARPARQPGLTLSKGTESPVEKPQPPVAANKPVGGPAPTDKPQTAPTKAAGRPPGTAPKGSQPPQSQPSQPSQNPNPQPTPGPAKAASPAVSPANPRQNPASQPAPDSYTSIPRKLPPGAQPLMFANPTLANKPKPQPQPEPEPQPLAPAPTIPMDPMDEPTPQPQPVKEPAPAKAAARPTAPTTAPTAASNYGPIRSPKTTAEPGIKPPEQTPAVAAKPEPTLNYANIPKVARIGPGPARRPPGPNRGPKAAPKPAPENQNPQPVQVERQPQVEKQPPPTKPTKPQAEPAPKPAPEPEIIADLGSVTPIGPTPTAAAPSLPRMTDEFDMAELDRMMAEVAQTEAATKAANRGTVSTFEDVFKNAEISAAENLARVSAYPEEGKKSQLQTAVEANKAKQEEPQVEDQAEEDKKDYVKMPARSNRGNSNPNESPPRSQTLNSKDVNFSS